MVLKILLTDGLAQEGKVIVEAAGMADDKKGISAEELLKVIQDYDAMIVRGRTKVTQAVLEAGKKLKVVGRMGVGVDNIDLQAAKEQGVTVVNSPLSTTVTVAELTMGFMLSLARSIPRADAGMKSEQWLKKELDGSELYQKVLGIIGYGQIGEAVSHRAQAFDMQVLSFDPVRPQEEVRASGAEPVDFDTLLRKSDIITLHIPLVNSTKHLLNEEAFNKMKDGVKVVCAARGGVIDEAALMKALESGKVSGAGLDVYETEPLKDYKLTSHSNVIATPHIGAQTVEAQKRAAIDISTEVLNALNGKALRWKIV